MALISATAVPVAGLTQALTAVNTTDTVVADDRTWLVVSNASGGAITVSIADPNSTVVGNAGTVVAQSVAAGATRLIALAAAHNNPSTGVATITYSSAASVSAAAYRR